MCEVIIVYFDFHLTYTFCAMESVLLYYKKTPKKAIIPLLQEVSVVKPNCGIRGQFSSIAFAD